MKIENGKWVDQYGDPVTVDNFNVSELMEIGKNVKAVYGKKITYDRINLISSIRNLTGRQESDLAYLLTQEGAISKLAGY